MTCGGGTRERVRTCYDPVTDDDARCVGDNIGMDPIPCNTEPCEGPGKYLYTDVALINLTNEKLSMVR